MTNSIDEIKAKIAGAAGPAEEDRVVFVMVRERGTPYVMAPPRAVLDQTAEHVERLLQRLPEEDRHAAMEHMIGDGLTAEDGDEAIRVGAMHACYMFSMSVSAEQLSRTSFVSICLDGTRVLLAGAPDRDTFASLLHEQMAERGVSLTIGAPPKTLQ